jgi:hypothetical protein
MDEVFEAAVKGQYSKPEKLTEENLSKIDDQSVK